MNEYEPKIKTLEIKGARTRLGYKQQDMAKLLGIATSTYEKKERGKARFNIGETFKLAEALKLSYEQLDDYLLGGMLRFFYPEVLPIGNRAEAVGISTPEID